MSGQDGADGRVPDPQGRMAGLPYDFRRPTVSRFRARVWNPAVSPERGGQVRGSVTSCRHD